MNQVIAVDVGGTKIAAAVVDQHGAVGDVQRRATPARAGADAVLDAVAELVLEVSGGRGVTALGVGTAGTVDAAGGVVVDATEALSGWRGTKVAAGLAERLGLLEGRIRVQNDVHAHAAGEAALGVGRGVDSMVFLGVGTGIGGAVVDHGIVRRGAHDAAGAVGHIPVPAASGMRCACGRHGHVEAVASGPGLFSAWAAAGDDGRAHDSVGVIELAAAGDPRALAALERSAAGLGQAVAGIVATLDPELVVIGGGMAESGEQWWDAVRRATLTELAGALGPVRLERARLGARAALVGAGLDAWHAIGASR